MPSPAHRREYDRPPITERIVEVHVIPGPTSLMTARDVLRGRWSDFPAVEDQQIGGFQIQWNPGEVAMQTTHVALPRVRFWTKDKKRLLQVGRELFAANLIGPEPGWEVLSPMFRRAFVEYREILQPKAVVKALLRYLNSVALPAGRSGRDLFSTFPQLPDERARVNAPFQMVVDMGDQRAGPSVIGLAFTGSEPEPTYALELVVESGQRNLGEPDALFQWAEAAHERVTELFDQSLTPEARKLFGEKGGT